MLPATRVRSTLLRLGAFGLAGGLAVGSFSAAAVHENLEFPAAIHTGTCEMPGDVVLEFGNLVRLPQGAPAEGEPAGAMGAQVVHGLPDDEEIDLSVDDLFAADHILAVFNAEGDTIVACGPIGAYTREQGDDLWIGLREQNDSRFSGIAHFDVDDDDDDDLDVEIYLVNSTPPPTPEGEATT
jgi:hypothetical protein